MRDCRRARLPLLGEEQVSKRSASVLLVSPLRKAPSVIGPGLRFESVDTNAVSAPPSSTSRGARSGLVRRAKVLSWLSVGWMTVEAGASIVAALVAGSVALLGFGLDSLIELASASIVIWRFTGDRIQSDAAERRAQLIAGCFAALAVYLLYDGITTLVGGPHPTVSWVGVAVSTGAIIVMPGLAPSQEPRRRAARLRRRQRRRRSVVAVCDRCSWGACQHPRQRRSRLVVVGPDHRPRHRWPRCARVPRSLGRRSLHGLRPRGLRGERREQLRTLPHA